MNYDNKTIFLTKNICFYDKKIQRSKRSTWSLTPGTGPTRSTVQTAVHSVWTGPLTTLMSEVALKFSSCIHIYVPCFRVVNDDFIYLLLLKTITTITHILTLFFIRKRSIKWNWSLDPKIMSLYSLLLLLKSWEKTSQIFIKILNRKWIPYCTYLWRVCSLTAWMNRELTTHTFEHKIFQSLITKW